MIPQFPKLVYCEKKLPNYSSSWRYKMCFIVTELPVRISYFNEVTVAVVNIHAHSNDMI